MSPSILNQVRDTALINRRKNGIHSQINKDFIHDWQSCRWDKPKMNIELPRDNPPQYSRCKIKLLD